MLFVFVFVLVMLLLSFLCIFGKNVFDGEDMIGFGEVGFFLDIVDFLFEDGRDFSWGGFGFGEGVGLDGSGCGILLWMD